MRGLASSWTLAAGAATALLWGGRATATTRSTGWQLLLLRVDGRWVGPTCRLCRRRGRQLDGLAVGLLQLRYHALERRCGRTATNELE